MLSVEDAQTAAAGAATGALTNGTNNSYDAMSSSFHINLVFWSAHHDAVVHMLSVICTSDGVL